MITLSTIANLRLFALLTASISVFRYHRHFNKTQNAAKPLSTRITSATARSRNPASKNQMHAGVKAPTSPPSLSLTQ